MIRNLSSIGQQNVLDSKYFIGNISNAEPAQSKSETVSKIDTIQLSSTPKEKKIDKKKVIIGVGIGIGAIATIGALIYGIKTGKIGKTGKTADKTIEEITKELKDIKFDKGVASLKDSGEKFTGKITHTLKNGDKVVIEYMDGVLQKSTRSGEVNFEKIYETIDGIKKVKKIVNGVVEITNLTAIKNSVINSQKELKSVLENSDKLSLEEFSKQTDKIKFKSKAQMREIENIIANKKAQSTAGTILTQENNFLKTLNVKVQDKKVDKDGNITMNVTFVIPKEQIA